MKKILSAGTKIELSTAPATEITAGVSAGLTDISSALTGFSAEASEREQIDTTSLKETHSKTYLYGLKDADSASSEAYFNLSTDEGKLFTEASTDDSKRVIQVTFEDGSTWASLCTLQPFGFDLSVGDAVKTTLTFKLSGEPKITVAGA